MQSAHVGGTSQAQHMFMLAMSPYRHQIYNIEKMGFEWFRQSKNVCYEHFVYMLSVMLIGMLLKNVFILYTL